MKVKENINCDIFHYNTHFFFQEKLEKALDCLTDDAQNLAVM